MKHIDAHRLLLRCPNCGSARWPVAMTDDDAALAFPSTPSEEQNPEAYEAGGGAIPPWVVDGCTCWDAECAVHGQEVAPHLQPAPPEKQERK